MTSHRLPCANMMTEYPDCGYIDSLEAPPECGPEPYNPQTDNLMSYSRKLCRDLFTAGQAQKFRATMINIRTELTYGIEGFQINPTYFGPEMIVQGATFDSTLKIIWTRAAPVNITGFSNSLGELSLSGPVPILLNQGDTLEINLAFDGSGLIGQCDAGSYFDTIHVATSNAALPDIKVPFEITVAYSDPSQTLTTAGPGCLFLNLPNTPALGNDTESALYAESKSLMYNGSLLIGMIDGTDTVVHMNLYGDNDFGVIDGFASGSDDFGRSTKSLRFITPDNHVHGEVTYTYGASSPVIDSCGYILIDYVLSNPCDTTVTFIPGIFCDFDVDTDIQFYNDASLGTIYDYIKVTNPSSDKSAGLVSLYNCNSNTTLRPIDNVALIWPTGSLSDQDAYSELAAGSDGAPITESDISALVSFGSTTLEQGQEAHYRTAVLYNNTSPFDLDDNVEEILSLEQGPPFDSDNDCVPTDLDNCPTVYNPDQTDDNSNGIGDVCEYICGDANGDADVNVSDAVWIINYVFVNGAPPDPLESGDANCDGDVNVSDAVWIINFVFINGFDPCDTDNNGIPDC